MRETTQNPDLSLPPTTKAYLHSGARGTLGRKFVWSLQNGEGVMGQKLWVTGASGWSGGVERILCQRANSQETLRPSAPFALWPSSLPSSRQNGTPVPEPERLGLRGASLSGRMTSDRRGVLRASEQRV